MTTFIKGDWDETPEKRLLPARQLDFWQERNYRGLCEKNIGSQKEKVNPSKQREGKTNGSESGEAKTAAFLYFHLKEMLPTP